MLFLTNDLLSKWGFFDGDILYHLVHETIPELKEKVNEEIEKDILPKDAFAMYFIDNLLEIIIRKYILPKLPYKIVLKRVVGHNPVRARYVNGVEIDDYNPEKNIKLEPEYIEVDDEIIKEEAIKYWNNPNYLKEIREKFPDTG